MATKDINAQNILRENKKFLNISRFNKGTSVFLCNRIKIANNIIA